MRKGKYIFFLLLCATCLSAKPFVVVLDPGHGGKDPGAVGSFSYEKDLNLRLALLTGQKIAEEFSDVKVVYTRSTDVFIPLQSRADIANKNNADLFISIHANASEMKDCRGVETFILGTEKAEKNLDVAMRENAVMKLEANYKTTYHGFDPNSVDSYIMFELLQNNYMDQSLLFASMVQDKFVGKLKRYNRGVQQASFWVLLKSACPSILFEMGFISNAQEEVFLNTDSAQQVMAKGLVEAFSLYYRRQMALNQAREEAASAQDATPTQSANGQTAQPQPQSQPQPKPQPQPQPQQRPKTTTTYYALQIYASKVPLEPDDPKLKGVPCECRKVGDLYKYYAIVTANRNNALRKQQELQSLFPDCWITKFEK
ncbi:MAG: N-acetylmuramoyl-L-alanine amidase [Paludibacteraceae bacterium]|nr:N-acetylmuramoyl-L-alanine amidase [Paludibacteraceae bacterium]